MGSGAATFSLQILGKQYDCSAGLPDGPVQASRLLPVFTAVADLVVEAHSSEPASKGKTVSCREGCAACCRHLGPVTKPEAWRLAALVASMLPERRDRIEARFRSAVDRLRETGLLDVIEGKAGPDADVSRNLSYRYFDLAIPCPFLEDEWCSIYQDRPMRCREHLATSPATLCSNPEHQPVETVAIPNRPSNALAAIGRGDETLQPSFLPLVLVLEWAALQQATEPALPAHEILRNFLVAFSSPAQPPMESRP